jgi:FTR1 family protein
MIPTFVITLREGVEAALVVAIAVAYVKRIGRLDLLPAVYRALLTAVAASFIGAWGLAEIGWNPDAYEGWVLLISAFFVGTMVVWMNRHGKHIKTEIESGLRKGRGAWGVFWFVFLMIFREGVETVTMLAALRLDTSGVMAVVGAVAGIVLAVLFGISFVRGTIRVNLKQFFRVTTVILVVVVAQLTITGLHELSESQVLPSSSREMAVIGPVVKNDVFFFITVLALVAAMVLFESKARRVTKTGDLEGAAKRKAEWTARRERFWMVTSCVASCAFIMLITAEFVYARSQTARSTPQVVAFENGAVRIPAAGVSDGNLHRFVVADQGSQVRFIIIERPDKTLATAYDACEICGTQGYYQKGEEVICRNCASDIVISSIGSHGGCNPIPLESRLEGGMVVIDEPAFERGIKMFRDQ